MSNIHIDTTTEKDAVRLTFSAPTESEVLTDALHTVLHLLRANCKMETVDTKQFNSLVETACELEDTIQRMLEDNTLPAAEVKVAAGVPTPTAATNDTSADAQTFKASITEISRKIILLLNPKEYTQVDRPSVSRIVDSMKQRVDIIAYENDAFQIFMDKDNAEELAAHALDILLQRHHAADPIRNIPAFSMAIMNRIVNLLVRKNHDYGNSFGDQLAEDGPIVFKIRMKDKISRLRTLLTTDAQVKDESIEDTLRDIIGYCILFLHHYKTN